MNTMIVSPLLRVSPDGPISASGDLVHLRQGELDGACGIYALTSAMIALGVLDREEVQNMHQWDGRTREGRFREAHKQLGVLITRGTFGTQLVELAKFLKGYGLESSYEQGSKKNVFDKAVAVIEDGQLPIIGVKWAGGGGHWLLAVGYQAVLNEGNLQPTHLLCLDPGDESPRTSLWNAVIEVFTEDGNAVHHGPLTSNHWGLDGVSTKCHLEDSVILSLKK